MENMDKEMAQNLSAQFVCPAQKFWVSMKKGFIGYP